jgi:hypothetical protein
MVDMPTKSKLKVAEKQAALEEWFPKYQALLAEKGLEFGSHIGQKAPERPQDETVEDWMDEEDAEMAEEVELGDEN